MVAVASQIDSSSEQFAANRASMMTFVERLRALETRAQKASSKRQATFEKRGQLIPSDRLNRLLDPGMPFLRLHTLANFGVDNPDQETSIPGASVLVGIGFVGGARCMIWVDDSGISAGAMTGKTGEVALSLQTICKRQKLPLIHLVESAGANLLQYQTELWSTFGAIFRNLAQMSAMGLPTLVVLHGGPRARRPRSANPLRTFVPSCEKLRQMWTTVQFGTATDWHPRSPPNGSEVISGVYRSSAKTAPPRRSYQSSHQQRYPNHPPRSCSARHPQSRYPPRPRHREYWFPDQDYPHQNWQGYAILKKAYPDLTDGLTDRSVSADRVFRKWPGASKRPFVRVSRVHEAVLQTSSYWRGSQQIAPSSNLSGMPQRPYQSPSNASGIATGVSNKICA